MSMSAREVELIEYEGSWWKEPGNRADVVAKRFGLTLDEYRDVIDVLIDTEAALTHDPLVVRRLRRQRDNKRTQRSGQRATGGIRP